MKIPKNLLSPKVLLISILLLGLLIRVINLWDNVIFDYDQARDAQRVYEIIKYGDLKIVGPETDIPGVFNGPLLYYLLIPAYWLSNFNPNIASLLFIFINLSGVILLYWTSKVLFKNSYLGLLAGFLWAIAAAQPNFARYISNASPMSITSLLFFLGLAIWVFNKKDYGLILSALGLGLAIHLNFYLVYLIIFYPLFAIIYRKKINLKLLIKPASVLLLTVSPLVIAELKWKFQMIRTMLDYFSHHASPTMIIDRFGEYIQKITSISYYSFFSFNYFFAFLLLLFFLYLNCKATKKDRFIFIFLWSMSTLPLFAFHSGVHTVEVINSSIYPVFTLLASVSVMYLLKTKVYRLAGITLLSLIILSNLSLMTRGKFLFNDFFEISEPVYIKDYYQLVDYTYQEAKGKEFSICSISVPLFFNTKYSFFYSQYGQKKYGYLPYWSGQEQFLNKSYLPYATKITKLRFIIIEPPIGMPDFVRNTTLYLEDQVSQLVEEVKFGNLIVQKRHYADNPETIKPSLNLGAVEVARIKNTASIDPRYSCLVIYTNEMNENTK